MFKLFTCDVVLFSNTGSQVWGNSAPQRPVGGTAGEPGSQP